MPFGAEASLTQKRARTFGLHQLTEIQAFDELRREAGARLVTKPALSDRQRGALRRPETIALGRHGFHSRAQAIALQIGRRNGQDRGEGRKRHEYRDNLLRLNVVPDLVDHRAAPVRNRS